MSALSQLELERREQAVDAAETDDFAELIGIARLDPKKHLRFADWSDVDFSGSDLRGFDFTGARLIGCNFTGARIEGARFDQALIDEVRRGAMLDFEPHKSAGRKRLGQTPSELEESRQARAGAFAAGRGVSGCAVCARDGGCPAGTILDGVEGW